MKTSLFPITCLLLVLAVCLSLLACDDGDDETEFVPTVGPASSTPASTIAVVTPGPGTILFRWGAVTILVPDEDFAVRRDRIRPPELGDGGPVLCFEPRDIIATPGGGACLDAYTGEVVGRDSTGSESVDAILATVRVGDPFPDPPPWPYGGSQPERERSGGLLRYWQPDPSAGIQFSVTVSEPTGAYLQIESAKSVLTIDSASGEVLSERTVIDPTDDESFNRWLASVDVATPPSAVTPGPGVALWRWANVTVLAPIPSLSNTQLYVTREDNGPNEAPTMRIVRRHPENNMDSGVTVDATTGSILWHEVYPADAAEIDAVVATLVVGEPMAEPRPWPYSDEAPVLPRSDMGPGKVSYALPDPASGIIASHLITEAPAGEDHLVILYNLRSRMAVYANTGAIHTTYGQVVPEDLDAFQRWVAAIESPQ